MKLFNSEFTIMEKSMDAYSLRAKALANNISNVNTPNYKREDTDFENILREAIDKENNPKIEGRTTNNRHIKINEHPSIDTIQAKIIKEKNLIMRNDRNSVDIEVEESEFSKNNIRYQFATNRLTQDFNIIRNVIKSK
ncbi:MAG: flagellar basal body rod protein FlgB [Fusobacteria bacterium]|jgi:flagellar basal-body rod protein FlgB|nr:flagellar basal body rod protein FlgB [Fusobacteriota bacterium]